MRERLKDFFAARPTSGQDGPRFTAPWRLFWAALILRLAYMTLAHTFRVRPYDDHFGFGFEAGRIARSLALGNGYADAFSSLLNPHTGPTAWLPPLFPLLLAGVFKLFGVYTPLSAWVILAINCVVSALTAMLVWELGARFAGSSVAASRVAPSRVAPSRVAPWAGWLWALHPGAMQYAVRWIWEMTITTALFTGVLVLALRMRAEPQRHTTRRWVLWGLAWGLIALSNSTLTLFLPFATLWILAPPWKSPTRNRNVCGAALAAVLVLAVMAPWVLRNQRVFHAFIPMRGNFGAEMYLGNGPDARGFLMEYDNVVQAPDQMRLYKQMGEVAYCKMRGQAAMAVIRANPAQFCANTVKRVYFFWVSVPHPVEKTWLTEAAREINFCFVSIAGLGGLWFALRRKMPAAWLFFGAVLLLPLPYYLVTVNARFRHPLEPILCVLGVWLFQLATPAKAKAV